MKFIPISIDKYVKMHIKNNPTENEKDLRDSLNVALKAYKNGERCSCGNDIWVLGATAVGNMCFTCITGESDPSDDYEIDEAIKKRYYIEDLRHIDDIDPSEIGGFFDDDGYEINADFVKKPTLCLTCTKNDNPNEEMLCNMTRLDQKEEEEFICYAYVKR